MRLIGMAVDRLFGEYTYELDWPDNPEDAIIIIYGDNGSGKTTLLRLAYRLLSRDRDRELYDDVSEVAFRSFSLHFDNGVVIRAHRDEPVNGPFTIELHNRSEVIYSGRFALKAETAAEINMYRASLDSFIAALSTLELDVLFIADDRRIQSSGDEFADVDEESEYDLRRYPPNVRRRRLASLPTTQDRYLAKSVQRFEENLRQEAIRASSQGFADTHTIYQRIVLDITQSIDPRSAASGIDVDAIVADLETNASLSRDYAEYDLTVPIEVASMVHAVRATEHSEGGRILATVIRPYLEGVQARLAALRPVYEATRRFLTTLKDFYSDKTATFTVRNGFRIKTTLSGKALPVRALSSGEKQLLLILSNVFAAQDRPTLLIIDEPELSLNIKWQQLFTDALRKCNYSGRAQLILATHSFDLIADNDERVCKLANLTAFA